MWMKSYVMLDRGLALHRANYPDAEFVRDRALKRSRQTVQADPNASSGKCPCLKLLVNTTTSVSLVGCGTSERRVSLNEVLSGRDKIFHQCRSQHCQFSRSMYAQLLAREAKSGASSYCLVNSPSVRGESATVPAHTRYFISV
jgi:hypothetical protein